MDLKGKKTKGFETIECENVTVRGVGCNYLWLFPLQSADKKRRLAFDLIQCSPGVLVYRMCKEYRWVISVASISGAIQSLVWMGLGTTAALVYLCLLPVAPYKDSNDFFRVTLVKLYFEGRNCKLDGSYLGQFEEDYRKEVSLFPQELVFSVMVAYVILSAFFFVLSVIFYKRRAARDKRGIALGWSALSLVICAADVLFTYAFVLDFLALKDYLSRVPENTLPSQVTEISYIPLPLALLASRFIAGWLWNFIIGFIIFVDALCCRNIITKPPKTPLKQTQNRPVEKVKQAEERPRKVETPPASPDNGHFRSYFLPGGPNFTETLKSVETTTKFNIEEKPSPAKERLVHSDTPGEAYWHPKPGICYTKGWEIENEGYESDEGRGRPDFDHDLKNFEPGQRKIKITGGPRGRPVGIPTPPPMPPSGSCNC